VGESGAIISEAAPGQPAQSWRFPARNRIIAALAQAVVVVESHAAGGSMLTVAAAADRGIDVLAVPGPVTSASSAGTNQLLHEGVAPVRDAGDVLAALGDLRPWPPPARPGPSDGQPKAKRQRGPAHVQPSPPIAEALRPTSASWGRPVRLEPPERRVLNSVDRTPTSTGVIADRTGLPIGALSVVLLHLEGLGLVRGEGTWWERRGDE
jgi:DNA processing protein